MFSKSDLLELYSKSLFFLAEFLKYKTRMDDNQAALFFFMKTFVFICE